MARDDPTMIDAEHKAQATAEKAAAAERKKKELARQKGAGNNEEIKETDLEQAEPLLDPNTEIKNPKAQKIKGSLN